MGLTLIIGTPLGHVYEQMFPMLSRGFRLGPLGAGHDPESALRPVRSEFPFGFCETYPYVLIPPFNPTGSLSMYLPMLGS